METDLSTTAAKFDMGLTSLAAAALGLRNGEVVKGVFMGVVAGVWD